MDSKNEKGYVTTVAGNGIQGTSDGQGTLAEFYFPNSITTDSIGNIYVGDTCALRKINLTGLEMGPKKKIFFFFSNLGLKLIINKNKLRICDNPCRK